MSDFDTVFKQFKDNTKPMCELMGCPELIEDFIVDVEINRQSFKSFYEAGQQSRQAEIDDLVDMVKTSADSEMNLFDELQRVIKDRDLLQKRIDEIDNHVGVNYDCERDDDQHSYWSGYNQALREIFEMLKGCTNE